MDDPFKIATFNVHHCEGRDGRVDVTRIARITEGLSADVVVFQELDVGVQRSRSADQAAELSQHLGMEVLFFPALELGNGSYGLGVAGRGLVGFVSEELPRRGREEPRIVVSGTWQGIRVVTSHLSRNEKARRAQTRRLAEMVVSERDPVIVLGDLNQPASDLAPLTSAGLTLVRLRRPLLSRLRPIYQIDHVLVSRHLRALEARTVRTNASDHDPLVASLTLVAGSGVEGNALS